MTTTSQATIPSRLLRMLAVCLLLSAACSGRADPPDEGVAASLRAKYEALRDQLANSPFHRPLYLDSTQKPGKLRGDVYALVEYPFAMVATAAGRSTQWCEILLLHLNVKYCSAAAGPPESTLTAFFGGKHEQVADAAYRVEFVHRVAAESADYLRVILSAARAICRIRTNTGRPPRWRCGRTSTHSDARRSDSPSSTGCPAASLSASATSAERSSAM